MLPVFQVRFSVVPKDNVSIEANFVNSRKVQKDGFSNRQTSLVYYIQNIKHKLVQQNWSTDLAGLGRNLQILFIIDIVQLFQTKDKWFLLKYQYPITIVQYEHRTIFSYTQNVNDGLSSTKNTVFFSIPFNTRRLAKPRPTNSWFSSILLNETTLGWKRPILLHANLAYNTNLPLCWRFYPMKIFLVLFGRTDCTQEILSQLARFETRGQSQNYVFHGLKTVTFLV